MENQFDIEKYKIQLDKLSFENLLRLKEEMSNLCSSYLEECMHKFFTWENAKKEYESSSLYKKTCIISDMIEAKATPELCIANNLYCVIDKEDDDPNYWRYKIDDFVNMAKLGCVTFYDGEGYYADENNEYKIAVSCKNASKEIINKSFKYINWYNK